MSNVVEAAKLILSVCDGAFSRDKKGYDLFDAGTLRFFFYPEMFNVEGLTPEEIEFMRRKLLRYAKQLEAMGFKTDKLSQVQHPLCFLAYGEDWEGRCLRLSPHSLQQHFPELYAKLKEGEGWCTSYTAYSKPSLLKKLWIRFNDVDESGETRKWWEA